MSSGNEEESIRLARGSDEQEIVISSPAYPDPFAAGTLTTRRDPPTQLALAPTARLPRWQRASVGVNHEIRQGLRLNADTFYERTSDDFRALDLNAPVAGVRPDPAFGRLLLVQSIGQATRGGVNLDVSFSPRQGTFSSLRYGYSRTFNDGDDALTPPPLGTAEGVQSREPQLVGRGPDVAVLRSADVRPGGPPRRARVEILVLTRDWRQKTARRGSAVFDASEKRGSAATRPAMRAAT